MISTETTWGIFLSSKKVKTAALSQSFQPSLSPLKSLAIVNDQEGFKVEAILDSRKTQLSHQYLIYWKCFSPNEHCWVAASSVHINCLVRSFHHVHPDKLAFFGPGEDNIRSMRNSTTINFPPPTDAARLLCHPWLENRSGATGNSSSTSIGRRRHSPWVAS